MAAPKKKLSAGTPPGLDEKSNNLTSEPTEVPKKTRRRRMKPLDARRIRRKKIVKVSCNLSITPEFKGILIDLAQSNGTTISDMVEQIVMLHTEEV